MGVDDGFLDYLERYGHKSRYLLECSVMDKFDRESDDWMVQYTAGQEICRDLTWALSMDAERVKTLSIPLSDITHYLPLGRPTSWRMATKRNFRAAGGMEDATDGEAAATRGYDFVWQKPEYVHVPALKIFDLRGLWVLDDPAVLEVLCSKVMPKVSDLIMDDGCDGFSLAEWVELTSSHLHLLMFAKIRMATTLNEVKRVGLGRMRGVPFYPSRYTLVKKPKGRIPEKKAVYEFHD
ncbi:hypothetical protein K457DRAFT_151231 [Linnemannia elongata AG-77]|uniref:Uncharacterized protein n=1 Tax=Linnemannia elongata AG-77 TaxID=1314771 RepID=A0A197KJA9_9FUNG|nr:hypothetical protein K457DRAFT_151231 [Linnemannia elongata AG-77]